MTDERAGDRRFDSLTLLLNRSRLQPYRVRISRPSESRERGFLTAAELRTHLIFVVNVPEGIVLEKVEEMERSSGPVTVTFPRGGSLFRGPAPDATDGPGCEGLSPEPFQTGR